MTKVKKFNDMDSLLKDVVIKRKQKKLFHKNIAGGKSKLYTLGNKFSIGNVHFAKPTTGDITLTSFYFILIFFKVVNIFNSFRMNFKIPCRVQFLFPV